MAATDHLERDLGELPCPIDLSGLRTFFGIVQMLREYDEDLCYMHALTDYRMAVTNGCSSEEIADARHSLLSDLQCSEHWTTYQATLNAIGGSDDEPARPSRRSNFLHIMQQVVPNVFIGGAPAAGDLPLLKTNGITHVVCLLPMRPPFPQHLCYLQLNVDDSIREDLYCHFPAINQFIQHALHTGGRVLVHCGAGISRASTAIMSFLMFGSGMPLDEAYSLVKAVRPIILPNRGFLRQLRQYEAELQAAGSVAPSRMPSIAPSRARSLVPSDDDDDDDDDDECGSAMADSVTPINSSVLDGLEQEARGDEKNGLRKGLRAKNITTVQCSDGRTISVV